MQALGKSNTCNPERDETQYQHIKKLDEKDKFVKEFNISIQKSEGREDW